MLVAACLMVGAILGGAAALVWVRWMMLREAKRLTEWKGM